MACESTRQTLIEFGMDAQRRHEVFLALQHFEICEACQAVLRQYDKISAAIDSSDDVAAPRDGWGSFEDNLIARVLQPARPWYLSRAVAIAACLLLAIGAFEIGRRVAMPHEGTVGVLTSGLNSAESTQFAPRELPADVGAFQQVSKVFDGQASWMLVSGNASDVGVASEPIASVRNVLLLRLTMSRAAGVVSDADLMIVPGQVADLKVPLDDGQVLHYRIGASSGQPTRLSIWLEVQTSHGGEALGALSTTLQVKPGQKFNAGQLVTSSGEYQLKVGFTQTAIQ